jgi:hypothetical protein
MKTVWPKIMHELKDLMPVTAYFLVTVQLLAITEALMLRQYNISASVFLTSALVALVVAKVVVIVDQFGPTNHTTSLPPVSNVLWKAAVYYLAVSFARYAEALFHIWRKTGSAEGAHGRLVDEIIWPHFWVVQLWLVILLVAFCAYRELDRALGAGRLTQIFLRRSIPRSEAA